MMRSFGLPFVVIASVIAVAACTGGPGPLPDDQTGQTGTGTRTGSGSDDRPSTAEPAQGSNDRPPSADDDNGGGKGADDPGVDDSDTRDGG